MQNARAHKLQWSGPTVHSSTVTASDNFERRTACDTTVHHSVHSVQQNNNLYRTIIRYY